MTRSTRNTSKQTAKVQPEKAQPDNVQPEKAPFDKVQFRHQVSTKTWIGKIYARHLGDESVDVDLRKNSMVEAIQAFWLPFTAHDEGVEGKELEEMVQRSLLALEFQRQKIITFFGVESPPNLAQPDPHGSAAVVSKPGVGAAPNSLINENYLFEHEKHPRL